MLARVFSPVFFTARLLKRDHEFDQVTLREVFCSPVASTALLHNNHNMKHRLYSVSVFQRKRIQLGNPQVLLHVHRVLFRDSAVRLQNENIQVAVLTSAANRPLFVQVTSLTWTHTVANYSVWCVCYVCLLNIVSYLWCIISLTNNASAVKTQ